MKKRSSKTVCFDIDMEIEKYRGIRKYIDKVDLVNFENFYYKLKLLSKITLSYLLL